MLSDERCTIAYAPAYAQGCSRLLKVGVTESPVQTIKRSLLLPGLAYWYTETVYSGAILPGRIFCHPVLDDTVAMTKVNALPNVPE